MCIECNIAKHQNKPCFPGYRGVIGNVSTLWIKASQNDLKKVKSFQNALSRLNHSEMLLLADIPEATEINRRKKCQPGML